MNLYNNTNLVEPGIKYFIKNTLIKCKELKDKYKNIFYNISLLVSFIVIVGGFLYYRYKNKLSNEQIEELNNQKQLYLMSKIKNYKQALKPNNNSITNLPKFTYY
jgi:hypothetical protein